MSLTDFYLSHIDKLYGDPIFKKLILEDLILDFQRFIKLNDILSEREMFEKILSSFFEEAELTLSLLNGLNFTKSSSLLEIGSGLGFVYGFLKKEGYDIYGMEPSDSGFNGFYNVAVQMLKIIGVDATHIYPLPAKECASIKQQFDIVFSNNVLEHVPEIEPSILALKNVLKPNGLMVHNTVNYFIPYEPHFNIVLFPLFPKLTVFFKPALRMSSLWNGLNFITTKKLKDICRLNNLDIDFKKDILQRTLVRLDTDPEFIIRHKFFIPLYKILKLTGLIKILKRIPVALTTPITFTIRKGNF